MKSQAIVHSSALRYDAMHTCDLYRASLKADAFIGLL